MFNDMNTLIAIRGIFQPGLLTPLFPRTVLQKASLDQLETKLVYMGMFMESWLSLLQ